MKPVWFAALAAALLAAPARAQKEPPPGAELLQSIEAWARENLDDRVLAALEQVDRDRVRNVLAELERRFNNPDLYDLAPLKDAARALLPLLQQSDETLPYALWLQSHLDYLDAAEQLRRSVTPPPPKRGTPAPKPPVPALPGPTITLQRTVWTRQLAQRPLPPRAKDYVPKLGPVFASEKVPAELVWIAEVESSFDPRAKSPSGAAGLFQITRPTAKSLGLSTWLPDERLHPEKSARAAARYLRYLHGRFGDWRLALAAYNAGEGRVNSLLQRQTTRTYDAIANRLPAETQMYVPKVEATLRKRTGVALSELKAPKG